jgi:hypothetical protein
MLGLAEAAIKQKAALPVRIVPSVTGLAVVSADGLPILDQSGRLVRRPIDHLIPTFALDGCFWLMA